ncbi:HTH-type transcriptional regulator AcrR [Thalassocella blandensis]|nr:HTH-type transcriptional regulator AcrR [Thalassocella blandensis]
MSEISANEPEKTQKVSDLKRAAILDAAITEFSEQGFEATSMDKIAAIAEVSKRTVYNHFPSKEVLFTEILGKLWEKSAAQLELEYKPGRPIRAQLEELLWLKMETLSNPTFIKLARVVMAEMIHSPERASDMVNRLGKREEGITLWIRAANADKRLMVDDVPFASQQLQSLIKSFAFWPQVTLNQSALPEAEQEKVIQSALDMFLSAYAIVE